MEKHMSQEDILTRPKSLSENMNLFLMGEYIKRHFEHNSPDVQWLVANWDLPFKKANIRSTTTWIKARAIDDIILSHYKNIMGQHYESIFDGDRADLDKIKNDNTEWFKKMYEISSSCNMCAATLVIPYDMKVACKIFQKLKDNPNQDTPFTIPNFLNQQTNQPCRIHMPNENSTIHIEIDLADELFNLEATSLHINQQIALYRCKKMKCPRTPYEEKILKNLYKNDYSPSTYNNGHETRLLGLLQWDLRLERKTLTEIRTILQDLNFLPFCPSKRTCSQNLKCAKKDECKNTLAKQLNTTAFSIEKQELASVTQKKGAYTYVGKDILIKRCDDFWNDEQGIYW